MERLPDRWRRRAVPLSRLWRHSRRPVARRRCDARHRGLHVEAEELVLREAPQMPMVPPSRHRLSFQQCRRFSCRTAASRHHPSQCLRAATGFDRRFPPHRPPHGAVAAPPQPAPLSRGARLILTVSFRWVCQTKEARREGSAAGFSTGERDGVTLTYSTGLRGLRSHTPEPLFAWLRFWPGLPTKTLVPAVITI